MGEKKTIAKILRVVSFNLDNLFTMDPSPPLDFVETGIKQPIQAPKSAHPSFVSDQTNVTHLPASPFPTHILYTPFIISF